MKPEIEIFEWVIVMNKGEEIILTENQYEFYAEDRKRNQVIFDGFEFNPAFVVQAYKRPADEIVRMYRCPDCNGGTMVAKGDKAIMCPLCKGTGADLKLLGYVE